MFISPGEVIGPVACASRLSARPSQKKAWPQARLRMLGELRRSVTILSPTAVLRPSSQPKLGLWQETQASTATRESRGSKNSVLPSSAFSGVYGLVFGKGISVGRTNSALRAAMSAGASAVLAVCVGVGVVPSASVESAGPMSDKIVVTASASRLQVIPKAPERNPNLG